jgi:hypothetical protein
MKERSQSKFSRARLPPSERRVRVEERPHVDAEGGAFVTFAVDERHGFGAHTDANADWVATASGCAYLERGEVLVKVGDRYRPAAFLAGKNLKPAAEYMCQDAPSEARVAP